MQECDVLIAGGGSAGLAAGVAAARAGARVLMIERGGCLGGMVPAGLVHSICGLYRLGTTPDKPVFANDGFPREFAERLLASGGASGPVRMGRVDVLLQHPFAFAQLADELVRETPGLEVRFHTEFVELLRDGREVTLDCRGRRDLVEAKTIVDATGDGVVAALLGAPFEQESAEKLQRPAFVFGIAGLDPTALADDGRMKIARRIVSAVQEGVLPPGALGAGLRASVREGEAFVTIDLAGPANYDPTDPGILTALEMEGRALAWEIARFLREQVTGFAGSGISVLPSRVAVRESRRIAGRYRIETADMELGAEFEDSVALATWPMELRETHRGAKLRFPRDDRPCGIPLRALRFRDHDHLFMAGRCISCSHEAQASLRVIGTCMATGEAAGRAAALAALS